MGIKEIRREHGLTQAEFAGMFGVHQTAVSQWETGRTSPDTAMAVQIARATGHTLDDVLGVHTHFTASAEKEKKEILMPDDSMTGANIRKGNQVYIAVCDEKPEDGSLVGVICRGESTVRYVRYIGNETLFLNARIPAEIRKAEPTDKIIGEVCGVYGNFGPGK
ncbi:MAG: helix-turn-helix domain-containing protein [Clostridia bacterium]|nr:helix-turn-helix domain-containing protein [Clostridia bacterium]MBQ5770827.1 helix-turn-helix domain-containing protein [Clostridia bacterium]